MSRAYNLATPLFIFFAAAWLASGAFLQFSWATFCASVLHMSEGAIIRIHVISVWTFLLTLSGLFLVHATIVLVPRWRRYVRPRAVCHIAVVASLYVIAVYGMMVHKPKFQRLYRYFGAQRPNQAMQRTASEPAFYVLRVCHPPFGCVARFSGLAVADLVSR